MIIYHRTSFAAAIDIIKSKAVRSAGNKSEYGINSGPFFFVQDYTEKEVPTGRCADEIALYFECDLAPHQTRRDYAYKHAILAGEIANMRDKLVLEFNPYRPDEMMQARIFPECPGCLKLVHFEASRQLARDAQSRFGSLILAQPLISIAYGRG